MERWEQPPTSGRVAARACGGFWLAALVAFALLAPVASAQGCANEARRAEQGSASLPDCRAYELVTPTDKDSGEPLAVVSVLEEAPLNGIAGAHAAVDGERMAWDSEHVLPGSQSFGLDYLSAREEGGWSTENVIPQQSVQNGLLCPDLVGIVGWSADLSKGVLADGFGQETARHSYYNESFECGHDEPRLVEGEPEGFQNLFLRDNDTRAYRLVNVTPSGVAPPPPPEEEIVQFFPASFLAGSTDLSHVVFEEELKLTPEAPSGDDLYEWNGGSVRLLTILPDGTPVAGSLAGATKNAGTEAIATHTPQPINVANYRHAVSANGTRVFFQAAGNLYVRENGERPQSPLGGHGECLQPTDACTVQVDASQGSGPGGGGQFLAAGESGAKVFFLDDASAGLTTDTMAGSGANLYEYDVESGRLTDLTPGGDTRVLGLSGASEDGSYLYFVAEGALEGTHGASTGEPNLYLYHAGSLTFIATLEAGTDKCDWAGENISCAEVGNPGVTARVSANGAFIGFASVKSLTGYDNRDVNSGQPDAEVFLYDAAANTLSCASCNPAGARPTAPGIIRYPAKPDTDETTNNAYPQRNVSDNGQVFFETSDELLPAATNGRRNVYEYEHGRLYLLSSGTSEADSYFLDATPSGSDAFFATAQRLLARDEDSVYDIYDARVGGGFPEPPAAAPPCASEGCRGSGEGTPAFPVPPSAGLTGAGNVSVLPQPVHRVSKRREPTRAQKLTRALKNCRRQPKRKQRSCRRSAHRRYGSAGGAKR